MTTAVAQPSVADDLERVYRADGDRLWRSLLSFTGDPDMAADAAAAAFVQALARGPALRDPGAWVWRAAFRIAAGELKQRRRLTFGSVPDGTYLEPDVDGELLAALQQLTDGQRACVVLHYYADLPVADISRRTGINPLAVRAHLSRGRRRLRQLLGEQR